MVLGSTTPVATAETVAQETVEEVTPQAAPVVTETSDDEDDTLSYFKQLAEDK